jgi:DNA uptake protein ComE-like DNA-binding protein
MKFNKSHFVFNLKQQNGVFLLVLVIILLSLGIYFLKNLAVAEELSSKELEEIKLVEKFLDSVRAEKAKPRKDTIYPFNPNFITDYKGYMLGMSVEEITRLKNFREQGKWVNSIKDFKSVTQVSDSLLNKISPSFKFPEWVNKRNTSAVKKVSHKAKLGNKDLNTVTKTELEEIYGVGDKLSQRILNYRLKIGGFVSNLQLKDIYGLPYETEQKILEEYSVISPKTIQKIAINTANVVQLSEIIYFDYELAREIIEYRELHEGIKTFEELAKIESFPAYKIDRIKLYLTIN